MVVGDTHVFPGFLTPVLTQVSFLSHQLVFSDTSAEVRCENMPGGGGGGGGGGGVASTWPQTHKHQVMSQTHTPLIHLVGAEKETT